jgi:hypothetical protein
MNVTVYRHEAYDKFLVTIERGDDVQQFTLYDLTIAELGEFISAITKED